MVVSETGTPVVLHGINRSGMEYTGPGGIAWSPLEFDRLIADWGATLIRLPINQQWVLPAEGYDPAPYLASMDHAVQLAEERGAYTLLTLQWLDHTTVRGYVQNGRRNFVPPLPNDGSIALWRILARRYREQPAVLFDILTEPHDALPDDVAALPGEVRVSMAQWQPWARTLVTAIRDEHPAAMVFVSGVNWGYDLRGFPIEGLNGLVYSTHVYRNKGRDWDGAFGRLSDSHCVFAAEWGGHEADVRWGRKLAAYLERRNIGWAAWGWPDSPPLIDSNGRPTGFGGLVRSLLQSGGRRHS